METFQTISSVPNQVGDPFTIRITPLDCSHHSLEVGAKGGCLKYPLQKESFEIIKSEV